MTKRILSLTSSPLPTLLGSSLLAISTFAACTGGERSVTGECPADEECSDLTPTGLEFLGAVFHDFPIQGGPGVTAIGGAQVVRLEREVDDDFIALEHDFDVVSDNGDAIAAAKGDGAEVILTGVATGADLLRIVEAGTDLLFDRYEVEARPLDSVTLTPPGFEAYDAAAPLTLLAGEVSVGVNLAASDGDRLVDEALLVETMGQDWTRDAWDVASTDHPVGTHEVTVISGDGQVFDLSIDVVDALDELVPERDGFDDVIDVGDGGEVCFDALAGAAVVSGLTWTFSATGPGTLSEAVENGCTYLTFDAAGEVELTASAGGIQTTATLATGAGAAHARRAGRTLRQTLGAPTSTPTAPRSAGRAGERARAIK